MLMAVAIYIESERGLLPDVKSLMQAVKYFYYGYARPEYPVEVKNKVLSGLNIHTCRGAEPKCIYPTLPVGKHFRSRQFEPDILPSLALHILQGLNLPPSLLQEVITDRHGVCRGDLGAHLFDESPTKRQ
jgi:hypothetical protein